MFELVEGNEKKGTSKPIIKTKDVKRRLLMMIDRIEWYPPGRFDNLTDMLYVTGSPNFVSIQILFSVNVQEDVAGQKLRLNSCRINIIIHSEMYTP